MICHRRKLVFIHVPKTAGTSIEAALGHHGDDVEVRRDAQDHRTLRQLQWPHQGSWRSTSTGDAAEALRAVKARVVRPEHAANRAWLTREQYATYLKFSVVRNPWARTWSWYRNVASDPAHRARLGVPDGVGFAAFVSSQVGRDCLRPQVHWLSDSRRRVGVDVVCRFETLDRDWEALSARVGMEFAPLAHVNAGSGSSGFVDAYDDATRRLVADRFREEIELFGYAFG